MRNSDDYGSTDGAPFISTKSGEPGREIRRLPIAARPMHRYYGRKIGRHDSFVHARVAQLVRAPDCGSGGPGFDPQPWYLF